MPRLWEWERQRRERNRKEKAKQERCRQHKGELKAAIQTLTQNSLAIPGENSLVERP